MAIVDWRNPTPLPERDGGCPLVSKFERFVSLSAADVAALEFLCDKPQRLSRHHVLIRQDEPSNALSIIIRGLAVRYRSLSGGRRQVLGYLAPGDLSDPFCADRGHFDHSITLLSDSWVTSVPTSRFLAVTRNHPQIERALLLTAIAEQTILREWLLNIGQRSAYEKLSHFLCEMAIRLTAAGQANRDQSVDLPLGQACLADTTGLTHIHVNRILKRLRSEQLVVINKRLLTIPDVERLIAAVEFERDYLEPQKLY